MLSLFYCPALTSIHTIGKTTALTIQTFAGKVISLVFNMLSRFVVTFLPRSKRLLISWLQPPSAVGQQWPAVRSGNWIQQSWEPRSACITPFEMDSSPYYSSYSELNRIIAAQLISPEYLWSYSLLLSVTIKVIGGFQGRKILGLLLFLTI